MAYDYERIEQVNRVEHGLGIRGGIRADITFDGVAFGAGVNHLVLDAAEAGLMVYHGQFEETSEITAFALFLNYLYGYQMNTSSAFLVGGVGLAYLGVYWEERSDTDTSLGTPLPGGYRFSL